MPDDCWEYLQSSRGSLEQLSAGPMCQTLLAKHKVKRWSHCFICKHEEPHHFWVEKRGGVNRHSSPPDLQCIWSQKTALASLRSERILARACFLVDLHTHQSKDQLKSPSDVLVIVITWLMLQYFAEAQTLYCLDSVACFLAFSC